MKRLIVIFAIIFSSSLVTSGQGRSVVKNPPGESTPFDRNSKPDTTRPSFSKIYPLSDDVPHPDGGIESWLKYIDKNRKYPKVAATKHIHGKVVVSFVVERNGKLTHIKVSRKLSPELDAEAVRLIRHSPIWVPGVVNGYIVRTAFSVPITFELS